MPLRRVFQNVCLIVTAEADSRLTFADLYAREAKHVLAYLRAHAADWVEAEELAAETFFRAWSAWSGFSPRGMGESAWLFRIARNLVIDAARRRRHRPAVSTRDAGGRDSTSGIAVAKLSLTAALAELTEDARELIGLRAAGLTFAEIGSLTGRSEDAAKMAWHRAARRLRTAMEARDD